jgi:hypothetical protein
LLVTSTLSTDSPSCPDPVPKKKDWLAVDMLPFRNASDAPKPSISWCTFDQFTVADCAVAVRNPPKKRMNTATKTAAGSLLYARSCAPESSAKSCMPVVTEEKGEAGRHFGVPEPK